MQNTIQAADTSTYMFPTILFSGDFNVVRHYAPPCEDFDKDVENCGDFSVGDFDAQWGEQWRRNADIQDVVPLWDSLPPSWTSTTSEYTSSSQSSSLLTPTSNHLSSFRSYPIDRSFTDESVASERFNQRLRDDTTIDPAAFSMLSPTPSFPHTVEKTYSKSGPVFAGEASYDEYPNDPLALPSSAKKLQCPFTGCPYSSDRSNNLKEHVAGPHLGRKPFPCPHQLCDRAFSREYDLKRHRGSVHRDPEYALYARVRRTGSEKSHVQRKAKRTRRDVK